MKQRINLLVLFLLSIVASNAQNWQVFNPDYVYHYQLNDDTFLHSHRYVEVVDSMGTKISTPNFWFQYEKGRLGWEYYNSINDSLPLIYRYTRSRLSGLFQSKYYQNGKQARFQGRVLNTKFSKTQAGYVYNKKGDSLHLMDYTLKNVLDTTDSVKVFENETERYVISKNFGLWAYDNFRDTIRIQPKGIQHVVGEQKSNWQDLIAHQPGDSLDYLFTGDYPYPGGFGWLVKHKYRLVVLERIEYDDNLVVKYIKRSNKYTRYWHAVEPSKEFLRLYTDTITEVYLKKDILQVVNEESTWDIKPRGQLMNDTFVYWEFDIDENGDHNYLYISNYGLIYHDWTSAYGNYYHQEYTTQNGAMIRGKKRGEFFSDSIFNMSGKSNVTKPNAFLHAYIYPNPGKIFNLEFNSEKGADLLVFNSAGKQVLSVADASNKYQLDMSAYDIGLYFIEIRSEQGVARKKLMVE